MGSEGAFNLCYYGYVGVPRRSDVYCLCSPESLLRHAFERCDSHPKHYLDWSVRLWSLWHHAADCSLARRVRLLEYLAHSENPPRSSLARREELEANTILLVCLHWHEYL